MTPFTRVESSSLPPTLPSTCFYKRNCDYMNTNAQKQKTKQKKNKNSILRIPYLDEFEVDILGVQVSDSQDCINCNLRKLSVAAVDAVLRFLKSTVLFIGNPKQINQKKKKLFFLSKLQLTSWSPVWSWRPRSATRYCSDRRGSGLQSRPGAVWRFWRRFRSLLGLKKTKQKKKN